MATFKPGANAQRNEALHFAIIAHGNQVRKGNEHIPYVFHCVDVANEVIYYSGLPVEELIVASVIALLHDTIEDTAATEDDLRRQFGDAVADGVAALSKNVKIKNKNVHSKLEQLKESLKRLKKALRYVQAVKLADRISNLKNFPAMWDRKKIENYLDESELIARELGPASTMLEARLLSRVAEARMMLSLMPS